MESAVDDWADVRHVAHTSWSHMVAKPTSKDDAEPCPRGRVVVALSRPVTPDELSAIAEWVLQSGRGKPGASELRSIIRAYVAPCVAPGGYEHYAHDPGRVLDVDAMLRALDRLRADVADELEAHAPDPDVWGMLDVRRGKDGEILGAYPHHKNLVTILRHDRRQRGRFTYDSFSEVLELDREPVGDVHILQLMEWMGSVYGIHPARDKLSDAARQVCNENTRHAVQDYLNGLEWDGIPRIQDLLWKYMGCKNTADGLSQVYGRKWLVSVVARAMRPGCKVDTMLILNGPQGARKSSGFRALAGDDWFSDSPISMGTDDAAQALQGTLILELAELDSFRHKDMTTVKAFTAAQSDRFRRRYDRFWTDRPRQSVMVGTSNDPAFLGDATGSRRFWVRRVVRPVDLAAIERDRDQLFAEAVHRFKAGEEWWLDDDEDARRSDDNEDYAIEQPWGQDLLSAADAAVQGGLLFHLPEMMAQVLDVKVGDVRRGDLMEAGRVLGAAGFEKTRCRVGGRRAVRWGRP